MKTLYPSITLTIEISENNLTLLGISILTYGTQIIPDMF